MRMKPSWRFEEGPPWIATTGLQVKLRDIERKWIWDQFFFSLKLIEDQLLNYEEDEEDFREKTAGQVHKLKQAMKIYLIL